MSDLIERLERPVPTVYDAHEAAAALRSAAAREAALVEALEKAHDHMHRLCAIIPGNDSAYKENTDLMAEIRKALAAAKGDAQS
jgi:hypothetical protein